MLVETLRDLQWRARRFIVATIGVALVFAVTLLLSGLSESFHSEARRMLADIGADVWLVRNGLTGPFTMFSPIPADLAEPVRADLAPARADPLVIFFSNEIRHRGNGSTSVHNVLVLGHESGGIGTPVVVDGRSAERSYEAVVDRALGLPVGAQMDLAGFYFTVVGRTEGRTVNAGIPTVFLSLHDARSVGFNNLELSSAIVVRGAGAHPLVHEGLQARSNDEVRVDMLRPLANATTAIRLVQYLLWIVAACIVATLVYLSALERTRDFAVLKAIGHTSRRLVVGLGLQAVLLTLAASGLAYVLAALIAPVFPLPVTVPGRALVLLPFVAVVVGAGASVIGARRAVTTDPTLAFGG
jgi:putative ABC transport system permease protein